MTRWQIRDEILKSIDTLVDYKLKYLKFNNMIYGLITEIVDDNTYRVKMFGREEMLKSINNERYEVGDVVFVVVWNNDYSNKTIVCKSTR
ncbi:hypothetical protein [Tissierella sp.]|uniref:hypothetical protein n=1 Tax=Tissierella sp. TaxID=41274 RepID=UPI0028B1E32D|nr:hypothetical protein [Tissierella sp.]